MKKISTSILSLIFCISASFSSAQVFSEKAAFISAGYGAGNLGIAVFNDLGSVLETKSFGPLHIKGEYAVSEHIGIGLNFAYASADLLTEDEVTFRNQEGVQEKLRWDAQWTSWSVLARMNVDMGRHDKIDPYWGLGIGFRDWTYDAISNNPNLEASKGSALINLGFETTLGLRVMPHENIGLYTEFGISKSLFQVGLTAKIGGRKNRL